MEVLYEHLLEVSFWYECGVLTVLLMMMVDHLRGHQSKLVKAWAEEHKAQIELFYLPSDSPVLNPDERLNADL